MSFKRGCPTSQLCKWGSWMPRKHRVPQLSLKILWTGEPEAKAKIKSTNDVSYSQAQPPWVWGSQAIQEVLRGRPCDCGDSRRAVCHGHVILGVQTSASAHEDARVCGAHCVPARSHVSARQPAPPLRVQSAVQALGFPYVGFLYLFQPSLQSHQPWQPISFTPIFSSQSPFPLPHSQWTKNKMEKKLFLTSLLHHQKHKRAAVFLWNHELFLITFS